MNRQEHDQAVRNLAEMPAPSLGIDHEKAARFLDQYRIRWDEIVLVHSFDEKARVIAEKGILVYFDDQPEMLKDIPSTVSVLLVRNGGNYDFDGKKWLFSKHTGRLV